MDSSTKLLITGERRSGTTLIANFLNEQEGITIYRDFLHIDTLKKRIGISGYEDLLRSEQKESLLSFFNHDTEQLGIDIYIDKNRFDTLFQFYEYVLSSIASPSDSIVGHKITLAHELIPHFLHHYKRMKVIFILRDPRDVVVSAIKKYSSLNKYLLIREWRKSYACLRKCLLDNRINSRIIVIKYEDFVLKTSQVVEQINRFLKNPNISIPETINDYGRPGFDNSSFRVNDNVDIIKTDSVGAWKTRDTHTGKIVQILLNDMISQEKYDISKPSKVFDKYICILKYKANVVAYLFRYWGFYVKKKMMNLR